MTTIHPLDTRPYDYELKFSLIGNIAVGKTSIIKKFITDRFDYVYQATIGMDFSSRVVNYTCDSEPLSYKLKIFDCAGQERYHAVTIHAYQHVHAFCIVFDIEQPESYQNIEFWYEQIKKYHIGDWKPVVMIVANKYDLDKKRHVPLTDIYKISAKLNIPFMEVSPLINYQISELFQELVHRCHHTIVIPIKCRVPGDKIKETIEAKRPDTVALQPIKRRSCLC